MPKLMRPALFTVIIATRISLSIGTASPMTNAYPEWLIGLITLSNRMGRGYR
jgi:hypothetical protein